MILHWPHAELEGNHLNKEQAQIAVGQDSLLDGDLWSTFDHLVGTVDYLGLDLINMDLSGKMRMVVVLVALIEMSGGILVLLHQPEYFWIALSSYRLLVKIEGHSQSHQSSFQFLSKQLPWLGVD